MAPGFSSWKSTITDSIRRGLWKPPSLAQQGRLGGLSEQRKELAVAFVALRTVLCRLEWSLRVGEVLLDPLAELLFGVKRGLRAGLLEFGRVARVALLG